MACGADLWARGGPAGMSSVLKSTNSCKDSGPKAAREETFGVLSESSP